MLYLSILETFEGYTFKYFSMQSDNMIKQFSNLFPVESHGEINFPILSSVSYLSI